MTTTAATELVSALIDAGVDDQEIARRLDLPLARVQRIADQLAGMAPGETLPVSASVSAKPKDQGQSKFTRPAQCGTTGGYQRHLRNKQTPCEPCREANRVYNRELAARRKAKRSAAEPALAAVAQSEPPAGMTARPSRIAAPPSELSSCGTAHGHSAHRRRGEKDCEACRASYRAYQREWMARRRAVKLAHPGRLLVRLHRGNRRWSVICPCCGRIVATECADTQAAGTAALAHVAEHRSAA